MSDIILFNIKIKDETYVRALKAPPNSIEKYELKAKVKSLQRDLETYILDAKNKFYT